MELATFGPGASSFKFGYSSRRSSIGVFDVLVRLLMLQMKLKLEIICHHP